MIRSIFVLLAVFLTPFVALSQPEWLSDGLVAYYPLDGDVADSGPKHLNGLARNVEVSADRFGRSIGSLKFTPEARSRVSLRGLELPSGFDPLTISFWFKIENPTLPEGGGFTKYPVFEVLDQGKSSWNLSFVFQGNGVDFIPVVEKFAEPFPTFAGDYAFEDPFRGLRDALQWHQGVLVCRGNSISEFYLDGVRIANRPGHLPNETTSFKATGSFTLGYGLIAPGGNAFSGDLDDLRIYGRALSRAEVADLYQYESAPPTIAPIEEWIDEELVAYYPLDGNANDYSGYGNDGANSGAEKTENRFNEMDKAYLFDSSSMIEVPYSPTLNPTEFTVSLWVQPQRTHSEYQSIITSRNDPPSSGYSIYIPPYGAGWEAWVGTGPDTGWRSVESDAEVMPGEWVHVVQSYRGGFLKLFIDGEFITSRPTQFEQNTIRPLRIGSGFTEGDPQYWFTGKVDDVRIYKRALSET